MREVIARSPRGRVVEEDPALVRIARRAIRQRRDQEFEVRKAA